jgi:branched-chain amino acid transport system permease protein
VAAFAQFVVAGLKSGAIYALVALGFTIVYASTGAINFAQGEFYMLGGMFGFWFVSLGLPIWAAAVAAIALTAAIGALFEILAVKPIADGDPLRIIIVTIGGAVVLRQIALHLFGPDEVPFRRSRRAHRSGRWRSGGTPDRLGLDTDSAGGRCSCAPLP